LSNIHGVEEYSRYITLFVINWRELELKPEFLGLKGSPTRVVSTKSPKVTRNGRIVTIKEDKDVGAAVDALIALLEERQLI